jgi:hypothetical protein
MVDDKFRSYRNHDTVAREEASRGSAEWAICWLSWLGSLAKAILRGIALPRLTTASFAREGSEGDGEWREYGTHAARGRIHDQRRPDDGRDGASSALDWAADDASPGQRQQGKDQYVALSRPQPSPVFSRIRPAGTIGGRFLPSPQAPTLLLTASDDRHDGDIQASKTGEAYGADDYDDLPSPHRRDGLVIVIAVLGLAILGAVAYLPIAPCSGAVLSALPALIEAENGPARTSRIMAMPGPAIRAKRP